MKWLYVAFMVILTSYWGIANYCDIKRGLGFEVHCSR